MQHLPAPAYTRQEDFLQNVTTPCKALMEGAKYHFFLLVFLIKALLDLGVSASMIISRSPPLQI